MLGEREGREVLRKVFEEAGLTIQEDFSMTLGSFYLNIDGYDPERRMGYEYITTEEDDRTVLHEALIEELDRLNEAGLMHLFLIDEQFIADRETLQLAGRAFLQEYLPRD